MTYFSKLTILFAVCTSAILTGIQATLHEESTSSITANENTRQYQPLYVVKKTNRYNFVDQATYESVMNQQISPSSDESHRDQILAACSEQPTTDQLLEIMPVDETQIVDGFRCDEPVEFFLKQQSNTHSKHYIIGFMIRDDTGMSFADNAFLSDIPTNNFPIPLIKVALHRINMKYWNFNVRHDIKYAKLLPKDDQLDQNLQNQTEYEKSLLLYEYDIDPAYEKSNQTEFIKALFKSESESESEFKSESESEFKSESESEFKLVKMQLAPVGDFYFDAWKRASFSNANTLPVWDVLIPEWHQLEIFIRRVAEVVGDLQIITGGVDSYGVFHFSGDHYPYFNPEQLPAVPVFQTIFKAVSFNQKRQNNQWIRQGIVFTMKNDPREGVVSSSRLAVENGWRYLEDQNAIPRISANIMDHIKMMTLGITISYTYELFKLHELKVLFEDFEGNEVVRIVNVLQEMKKFSKLDGSAVDIKMKKD